MGFADVSAFLHGFVQRCSFESSYPHPPHVEHVVWLLTSQCSSSDARSEGKSTGEDCEPDRVRDKDNVRRGSAFG